MQHIVEDEVVIEVLLVRQASTVAKGRQVIVRPKDPRDQDLLVHLL